MQQQLLSQYQKDYVAKSQEYQTFFERCQKEEKTLLDEEQVFVYLGNIYEVQRLIVEQRKIEEEQVLKFLSIYLHNREKKKKRHKKQKEEGKI